MAKQRKRKPSKKSKNAGVKGLMADGVKTTKEARELEKIFLEDLEKKKKQIKNINKAALKSVMKGLEQAARGEFVESPIKSKKGKK